MRHLGNEGCFSWRIYATPGQDELTGRLQENDIFEITATSPRCQWVNAYPFSANDKLSIYVPPINDKHMYCDTVKLSAC